MGEVGESDQGRLLLLYGVFVRGEELDRLHASNSTAAAASSVMSEKQCAKLNDRSEKAKQRRRSVCGYVVMYWVA